MNKNNLKVSIQALLITLVLTLSTSCNKYLDTAPDNRTEINTVEKVAQLIASSYPKASYAAMLNSRVDYVSDKGAGTEHDSNTFPFFWRDVDATSQDTPVYFWNKCYASVAQINHALEAVSQIDIQEKELAPYLGEAYIVRSFSHFLLASLYAKPYEKDGLNNSPGIPYITQRETSVIQKYDRGTVQQTWEAIEKDLIQGLKLIGSDAVYKVPRYHFTATAARAYATRFYLYRGDWSKVIEYANLAFPVATPNAKGNVDATDPANVYASNNFQPWLEYYATVPSSNDIKNRYTKGDNSSNLLLCEMPSRLSRYANGWRYGCNSNDVNTSVKAKNATGGTWGFRTYSSSSTHYYIPKYREHFVKESISATTGTIYTIFPYFRQEEILLNRAEAYIQLNNLNAALADLNVYCRQRVKSYNQTTNILSTDKVINFFKNQLNNPELFLDKYNAYQVSSWSLERKALLLFLLECRRNEFMWEGLRYWDMWRYKEPITHTNFAGESNTLYPDDDRWVLQIPETAKLSGIEPNPRTNLLSKEW